MRVHCTDTSLLGHIRRTWVISVLRFAYTFQVAGEHEAMHSTLARLNATSNGEVCEQDVLYR